MENGRCIKLVNISVIY